MQHLVRIFFFVLVPIAGLAGGDNQGATLRSSLDRLGVPVEQAGLAEAPIDGFYEIVRGAELLYLSHDGEILIAGDIVSMSRELNLTERRRAGIRLDLVSTIRPLDRIRIPARAPRKAVITVFVDTNCPYCLKFHQSVEELSAEGIAVDYVFYPRSGPGSAAFSAAVATWCAESPLDALDLAFAGRAADSPACPNPVRRHYDIARALELRGTPAIVLPDGAIRYGVMDTAETVATVLAAMPTQ